VKAAERRDELLRLIRQRGYVNVSQAAAELAVDTSTVRRDLARLDDLGLVERSHGGALPQRDEAEVPYDVKIGRLVAEKQAIGQLVSTLIPEGSTVILDSGSTTLMVAQALTEHRGITVITPDVRIAAELLFQPDIRVIVPGGEGLAGTSTLLSQEAVESMRRFHVDVAVMAVDAVDAEVTSNLNSAVVPLKRAMMGAARHTILAVDSSKFGSRKLVRVAPVEEFDEIVTDAGLDEPTAAGFPVPVRRAAVNHEGVLPA
jgi:DeoR/GlpR family transcriptional regulator of sugar metabolism